MDKGNTHIEYTGADILAYFAGKLDASEMHAMEKAALDDPFLAEAMEGYSSLPADEIAQQLLLLQENLPGQQAGKLVKIGRQRSAGWKAAAAILVISVGLAITYLFTSRDKTINPTVARIDQPQLENTAIPPVLRDSVSATGSPGTAASKETATTLVLPQNQAVKVDSGFIYRPARPIKETAEDVSGGGYIAQSESKPPDVTTSNNVEVYAQSNAARNAPPVNQPGAETKAVTGEVGPAAVLRFTAQVLAADNTPLPFANVRVTGENTGTYADAKGHFNLLAKDSTLQVEIKSVGYIARNLTLKADNMPDKIFLVPDDLALKDQTVISGKSSSVKRSRRAVLQADTVMNAHPEDGWQNYDAYVTNNLEISNAIREQQIHGEVEISFDVLNTGDLTNLKVDKSLCDDCDEAVLRLLKAGPKWKVDSGKSAKGKLRVKF